MFTILSGAEVYSPEPLGTNDILLWEDRIVSIGEGLRPPAWADGCEVVDVSGRIVAPGFIDYHNHFLGGGGSSGYSSRVPELPLTGLTLAGITTVVGCLGMDCTTRSMGPLYGKACSLEAEGVTTFIYTGSTFEHPIPTLTGRVRTDIIYVDKVVGVGEISLSELGPQHDSCGPGAEYIAKIACETVLASRISGKAGVICLQVPGRGRCLDPLFEILEKTGLPIHHFVPAHVNQNRHYFEQAIKFGAMGGITDVTSTYSPEHGFQKAIKPSEAVRVLMESGVRKDRVTMSTDGNGAHPHGDDDGRPSGSTYLSASTLLTEFRDLMLLEELPLEDALRVVTSNPARVLRLSHRKGNLKKGADADLVVLTKDFVLDKVFARGRLMVDEGKPIVRGAWEDVI